MLRGLIGRLLPRRRATAGRQPHELPHAERVLLARSEVLTVRLRLGQLRAEWLGALSEAARQRIERLEQEEMSKIQAIEEKYFPTGDRVK
jgi:hypothetical protein